MRKRFGINHKDHAIVLKQSLDRDWMAANLIADQPYWDDHDGLCTPTLRATIIGVVSEHLGTHRILYRFTNAVNKQRVLTILPDWVVDADPFGPNVCPQCGGDQVAHLPRWLKRLLRIHPL